MLAPGHRARHPNVRAGCTIAPEVRERFLESTLVSAHRFAQDFLGQTDNFVRSREHCVGGAEIESCNQILISVGSRKGTEIFFELCGGSFAVIPNRAIT